MTNEALALFVPFSAPDEPWVVRRARTVVETYSSRQEALMGALKLASELGERMGSDVRIDVQAPDGEWETLSRDQARKSARSYASLGRKKQSNFPQTNGGSAA